MDVAGANARIESSLPAYQHPIAKQLVIAVAKHGRVSVPGYSDREVARKMVEVGILSETLEGFSLADGNAEVFL